MSALYERIVTVTLDGDEQDVRASAHVLVEPGLGVGGGIGAAVDGDVMIWIDDAMRAADAVDLAAGDIERLTSALEEAALNDDTDQCVEWGWAAE